MPVTRSDIPNLAIHPSFCGLISTVIFPCPSLPSSCSSKSQKKIMLSVALSLIFSATLTKIIWVWHLTGALRWGSEKDLFERGEKKKRKGCWWALQNCMTGELFHFLENECCFFFLLSAGLKWILQFCCLLIFIPLYTVTVTVHLLHQWHVICTLWRLPNFNFVIQHFGISY